MTTGDPTRPLLRLADYLNALEPSLIVTYEEASSGLFTAMSAPSAPLPTVETAEVAVTARGSQAAAGLLRQAAAEHQQLGYPGRFVVLEAPPMIHVVQTGASTEPALLDQAVTMPELVGTGLDFVTAFVEALGGPSALAAGMLPFNVLDQHRGVWPSWHAVAREQLRELSLSVQGGLSWAILYDASSQRHVLNMKTAAQRRAI